jgi:hypothetical protein
MWRLSSNHDVCGVLVMVFVLVEFMTLDRSTAGFTFAI